MLSDSGSAILRLSKGAALFVGPLADTELHTHHAIQIVLSLDDFFEIHLGDERLQAKMIVLNSDIPHQFLSKGKVNLLLFIEPESDFGNVIQSKINADYQIFHEHEILLGKIRASVDGEELSIRKVRNCLFDHWQVKNIIPKADDRIKRVLALIEEIPDRKISVPALAQSVDLSESRLQHIFKDHTGISMKRYMLWKRMIDGVNLALRGRDLTTAAYEAGFSDGAHMSRTFKGMFGINLSKIFENSRSVQVVIEQAE